MKLTIQHQDRYSRGELLLRTFLGIFYIYIPHAFILFFVGFWAMLQMIAAFFIVLFTGKYPEGIFNYFVGLFRWQTRLTARMYNISDGYPGFGLKTTEEHTDFSVDRPEKVNQGLVLLRFFFGGLYVGIPHGFILMFRAIWVGILLFLTWWSILFTAKIPKNWHDWIVGQLRWQYRVSLYLMYMTDTYPPFTGDEVPGE
jgi:hypothetical protein